MPNRQGWLTELSSMVHPYFMVYIRFFKLRWQMGGKSTELQQIQPVKPPISSPIKRQFLHEPSARTYRRTEPL